MRRNYALTALALLIVLACPMLTIGQAAGTGASVTPDHVTLTWTADPAKTITISWRTDTSVAAGVVQYCKGKTMLPKAQIAKAASSDFSTDLGTAKLFSATLTGLSANTTYSYRVGDGGRWSGVYTFTTADPKARKFKFLVFGDSQSIATGDHPYSEWHTTITNAYKANPDAKFFVNVGDLVDVGQSGAHWNGWYAAAADVVSRIPVMASTGNHESGGIKDMRRPAYWDAQLRYPQNGPDVDKNQAYSYSYGNVHFDVLDSQQAEQKQYGDILTPEKAWLDADLAATKATWKLAVFHKAPYELHVSRKSKDVKDAFCPIFDAHHVDLVLNGHDHGLARTYPIKADAYMTKPSQGTVYCVCGRSGSKFYKDIEKKPWNTYFYNPTDMPVYMVVEVADQVLTVKSYRQDGKLLDTFFIDKKHDVDSDCVKN